MAKKKALTPVNAGALVVTIKAVFEVKDGADVEELLEELQGRGAASVIERQLVKESFDEAVQIVLKDRVIP